MNYPVLVYSGIRIKRRSQMAIPWPDEVAFAAICNNPEELRLAGAPALSHDIIITVVSLANPYAVAQMIHAGTVRKPEDAEFIMPERSEAEVHDR